MMPDDLDRFAEYVRQLERRLAYLEERSLKGARVQIGKQRPGRVDLETANRATIEVFPDAVVGINSASPTGFVLQATDGTDKERFWIAEFH